MRRPSSMAACDARRICPSVPTCTARDTGVTKGLSGSVLDRDAVEPVRSSNASSAVAIIPVFGVLRTAEFTRLAELSASLRNCLE